MPGAGAPLLSRRFEIWKDAMLKLTMARSMVLHQKTETYIPFAANDTFKRFAMIL
jgi:hypothetical protein